MADYLNFEVLDDRMVKVLRDKTPAERVRIAAAANRTARLIAAAGIHYQHPDWQSSDIQAEVVRRVTGGTNRPA